MSVCCEQFCVEIVKFKGHRNVRATHETTLEITKEDYLTPRGDCIIGVSADKALKDFSTEFKERVRSDDATVIVLIVTDKGNYDVIRAKGSSRLTYEDPTRIIIRKSTYVSPNTAAILSDKAAKDIKRSVINDLKLGGSGVAVFIVTRT